MSPKYDRPAAGEYYQYYSTYIDKVPEGDLLDLLARQASEILTALRDIPEEKAGSAYAPGKWTLKEVVGHMADTERVMSYRALTFGRGDPTPLPSFDENAWVPPAGFNARSLPSLMDELIAVRSATVALLSGLPAEATTRAGTASNKPISVRALAHIIHGHVTHHLGIIQTRYLS